MGDSGFGELATPAPDPTPSPIACDLGTEGNRIVRAAVATGGGISTGIDSAISAMASPGVKVFHNAPFDMARLWEAGVEVMPPIFDTMLAFHTLYPYLPKTLESVSSLYLDVERWKDGDKDESVKWDAKITYELYTYLHDELAVTGQLDCFEAMMRAWPTLVRTGLGYRIPFKDDRGGIECQPLAIKPDPGWVVVSGRYKSDEAMLAIATVLCCHQEPIRDLAHQVGIRTAILGRDEEDPSEAPEVRPLAGTPGPPHGDCGADDRVGAELDAPHDVAVPSGRKPKLVRGAPRTPGLAKLKRLYPAFFIWRDTLHAVSRAKRTVANDYGRRVHCSKWSRRRIARWVCESTLNDIMWELLPEAESEIQALGGRLAAVTSTEVVALVPESAVPAALELFDGWGWDAAGTIREP